MGGLTMLDSAFHLALADLRHTLRRREVWLWTFVLPIVFFYFIGTITARMGGGDGPDTLAVVVPPEAGFLADRFVNHLTAGGYTVVRVKSPEGLEHVNEERKVFVPADFTQSLLNRKQAKLSFRHRDDGQSDDSDRFRIQKAAYESVADMATVQLQGKPVDAASLIALDSAPRNLELVKQTAGTRREIPTGFEQAVPGTMVFFLLLVLMTNNAANLVAERDAGILRRLASAPMSRGAVVLGKWGVRMMLGVMQIIFCMLAGRFLFHVHWGPYVIVVLVVMVVYGSFCAAMGLWLGSIARTRQQAGGLGALASNILACIGGCWWPVEIMPRAMQTFSKLTPTGLTMDALHQLVNFGSVPQVILPHVAALALLAVGAGALAARSFKFV